MSAITTIYDAMVTRISTILPNHVRLTNPYAISENNDRFLKQGWGLAIGSGVNTEQLLSCQFTTDREFRVIISRQYYAREFDVTSKASTEKDLYEDLHLVVKDLQKHNTLNTGIYIVTYQGDDGIQNVFGERDVFLYILARVTVRYQEDFT